MEKNVLMLACPILRDEIEMVAARTSVRFPIVFIPTDLHQTPDRLRNYLQETIDRLFHVDLLLLPMGRCGNGTIGLKSANAAIVLPRCEDCVNLILSGESVEVERPKYTYFLTDGWLREKGAINNEYDRTIEKYGPEKAKMVMEMLYGNYRYFSLMDTGAYDLKQAAKKVRPLADLTRLEINTLPGPCGVLEKMMRLEFDENFIAIPPGEEVTEEHFLSHCR